jgi:hypothetical protein
MRRSVAQASACEGSSIMVYCEMSVYFRSVRSPDQCAPSRVLRLCGLPRVLSERWKRFARTTASSIHPQLMQRVDASCIGVLTRCPNQRRFHRQVAPDSVGRPYASFFTQCRNGDISLTSALSDIMLTTTPRSPDSIFLARELCALPDRRSPVCRSSAPVSFE